MSYGLRQPLVATMFRYDIITFGTCLPSNHLRMRFVAYDKRGALVSSILLRIVYLYGRMVSGRAKQVALMQIGVVNIVARIDDECATTSRDFYAESII